MNNYMKLALSFFVSMFVLNGETFCMDKAIVQDLEDGKEQLDIQFLGRQDCSYEIVARDSLETSFGLWRNYSVFHHRKEVIFVTSAFQKSYRQLNGWTRCVYKPLFGVVFSFDSKHSIICSEDKIVRLWEEETGKCLKMIKDPQQKFISVEFLNTTDFKALSYSYISKFCHGGEQYPFTVTRTYKNQKEYTYRIKRHDNFVKKTQDNQFADINIIYLKDTQNSFIELAKFIKQLVFFSALGSKKVA